ncbi:MULTISPECIES: hypothetical protein [Morganellaceae]|uniref:Nickase n=2 Tax=Morganellaceae TaxID=1903414 RepID=A0A9Q8Q3D4_9GAMM|nr:MULTISPECIES: hypothetical protein [Morganellaceae]UNH29032.1 hypothetical protein MNY64_17495 [Moellerella wisconsensis]UNH32408.1 hypothetical protein MNY72_16895 [Moellerella wisconsensis]WJW83634.1 hypothetical protein QU516_15565 [Moellerella wisconsensis]
MMTSFELQGFVYIGMFLSLFWRPKNVSFVLPAGIAFYLFTTGFVQSTIPLIVACGCLTLSAVVMAAQIMSRFSSKDDELDESDDHDECPASGAKRPSRTVTTEHEGKLVSFGMAHWKHDRANDMSFYVEIEGQNKVWAIGLKDAVKNSGAQIGDTVVFWKDSEVRTSKAQVFDRNGTVTGYRDLSTDKRRGLWIMEVVS